MVARAGAPWLEALAQAVEVKEVAPPEFLVEQSGGPDQLRAVSCGFAMVEF